MNAQDRLHALSTFLKLKRAQIKPESIGLPVGSRRRTPGLRREEVAQLAGVSTTWYTWLEQGRDINVSRSVLDCIANALHLSKDEREYVYDLALGTTVATSHVTEALPISKMNPSLEKILSGLTYCPTIVTDRHCHIVGWNTAAANVFIDFATIPESERNLIRLVFAQKEFRVLAVNWDHFAKGFLSIFRTYYGQYVGDEWYTTFIQDMSRMYPEFQELWIDSQVSKAPEMMIEFRHAKIGKMLFDLTSLQVQGESDLRCSVYTPVEHTDTEKKLNRLMALNN